MKFTLANVLLLSGALAADKAEAWKPTEAQMKEFGPIFWTEFGRYQDLPRGSKLKRMWNKFMRDDLKMLSKIATHETFKKGGAFDKFAGEDGKMNLEEAKAFNEAAKKATGKFWGEKVPNYPKGHLEKIYKAYDHLSEGEGFTKEDALHAQQIMYMMRDKVRNWRPTKEQRKSFGKIFRAHEKMMEKLGDKSKLGKLYQRWREHRLGKLQREMNKMMYKKGGAFDKFAGEDGRMSFEEAKKMDAAMRAIQSKKFGEALPKWSDKSFKQAYDAYDALSKEAGVSKKDSMTGQAIMEKLNDWRITDEEIDTYYPMGEMVYEEMDDLPKKSPLRRRFMNWISNGGETKQHMKSFDLIDKDHNKIINKHEFMQGLKMQHKMLHKKFGKKIPEWSRGDKNFFWIMADAMDQGRWNHFGHRGNGVSKADWRRMERLMRKVYQDIEDSDDSSDSDSDDDDKKKDNKKKDHKKKDKKKLEEEEEDEEDEEEFEEEDDMFLI